MRNILSVILAAGEGTRMKSKKTKVLHEICGRPMVSFVLDTCLEAGIERNILVVGHQAERVKETLEKQGQEYVYQKEQLGTGHAVMKAEDLIRDHDGDIVVLYGDIPLLRPETLRELMAFHQKGKQAATVLTAVVDDPGGYGRVVRSGDGGDYIGRIVEDKDATERERQIREINTGIYCFQAAELLPELASLQPDNVQGEYYLTDVIEGLVERECRVAAYTADDEEEILGVNTRADLAQAEGIIREHKRRELMAEGVSLIDPSSTYIDPEVEVARDTVVYPQTYLEGNTVIGEECVIGPQTRIINSHVADGVEIQSSTVIESRLGEGAKVGPYAYLRPGTVLSREAKAGTFVEIKNSSIGSRSKVPHQSYVGDTEIGKDTNLGAGTITANYDGKDKHKTHLGDNVFIGSNTTLVAPVRVGNGGGTGAGAVVTRDVSEKTLVVGVPARFFRKYD